MSRELDFMMRKNLIPMPGLSVMCHILRVGFVRRSHNAPIELSGGKYRILLTDDEEIEPVNLNFFGVTKDGVWADQTVIHLGGPFAPRTSPSRGSNP